MRILNGKDGEEASRYVALCAQLALRSKCLRSRCGSVIVKDGEVIGEGWNSPPLDREIAVCRKDSLGKGFISDATCCIHAEQRAVLSAMAKGREAVKGSRIYFVRLDDKGAKKPSGEPYCTHCSKLCIDAGVAEFTLWRDAGACVYDADEYNEKSFEYRRKE